MRPAIFAVMAFSLFGCKREFTVNIDINIVDTGSSNIASSSTGSSGGSSNQNSNQSNEEPSFEPSDDPNSDPPENGQGGTQGGDQGGGGDGPPDGPVPGDTAGGGGDAPEPPPSFCDLLSEFLTCGESSSAEAGEEVCNEDPQSSSAIEPWMPFFDCLVEAGSDCAAMIQCESHIPS